MSCRTAKGGPGLFLALPPCLMPRSTTGHLKSLLAPTSTSLRYRRGRVTKKMYRILLLLALHSIVRRLGGFDLRCPVCMLEMGDIHNFQYAGQKHVSVTPRYLDFPPLHSIGAVLPLDANNQLQVGRLAQSGCKQSSSLDEISGSSILLCLSSL